MNKTMLGYILLTVAIFLGIVEHGQYCEILNKVGVSQCPTPIMHSVGAIVVFALAVLMSQYEHLTYLLPK